ncbi:chlorocatechol 1,2-dioxygenase-like [Brevipalpus obovatus]|uniref:chlorocatechol 1,2-dioxygenase-like n=1 Tax=Brevipalpus obovatus TaxID=246614 RepID=UPI003D9F3FDA
MASDSSCQLDEKTLNDNTTVINCANNGQSSLPHSHVLAPMSTEGPYFIPEDPERSDISEGMPGIRLEMTIALVKAANGKPVSGAVIHVWHCDADGKYSGFDSSIPIPPNYPHPRIRLPPTNDRRYLRGYQITDDDGMATFTTIVPGWYHSRSIHIHLEVNLENAVVYIGQLFFEEEIAKMIEKIEPYALIDKERRTNQKDIIYRRENGDQTVLKLSGDIKNGFKSKVILGIDA